LPGDSICKEECAKSACFNRLSKAIEKELLVSKQARQRSAKANYGDEINKHPIGETPSITYHHRHHCNYSFHSKV